MSVKPESHSQSGTTEEKKVVSFNGLFIQRCRGYHRVLLKECRRSDWHFQVGPRKNNKIIEEKYTSLLNRRSQAYLLLLFCKLLSSFPAQNSLFLNR